MAETKELRLSLYYFVCQYWLFLAAVGIVLRLVCNRYWTPLRNIPGPFLASCTRFPRFFSVLTGRPYEWELKQHKKYGRLVRTGPDLVSVGDPAEINNIYGSACLFPKVYNRSLIYY